jgi:DNA-binding NarL/FixJ family response regulator
LRVYILDRPGKSRGQMLEWLSEDKRLTGIEAFDDYIQFIEQVGNSPPDYCIIRLGADGIPGLKTAEMVRQISADIRIIFISDDRDYALDAFEAGANGHLLCPVDRDQLKKYLKIKKET